MSVNSQGVIDPYASRVCQIKDLPDVHASEAQKYQREFYCYTLKRFEDLSSSRPALLFVSDFTSHSSLNSKSFDTGEHVFNSDQIIEVAIYPRFLEQIRREYSERTQNQNYKMTAVVYQEVMILKLKVRLKVYNGKLEGYALGVKIPRIEDEPEQEGSYLKMLYEKLFILQPILLSSMNTLPCIIPQSLWPAMFEHDNPNSLVKPPPVVRSSSQQYQSRQASQLQQLQSPQSRQFVSDSMPATIYYENVFFNQPLHAEPTSQPIYVNYNPGQAHPLQERIDFSGDSNSNSNNKPHTDSNSNDSLQFGSVIGAPQSQVKVEYSPPLVGSRIPDREYSGDYEDDSDDDNNHNTTTTTANEIQVPATSNSTVTSSSGGSYKFSELSKISNVIDNRIYPTEGYLVGLFPQDFTHAVAKTYKYDDSTERHEPQDPSPRQMELIFCNRPSSKGRDVILTSTNSIRVVIPVNKVQKFFDEKSYEFTYLGLPKLNQYVYKNFSIISKKLYKLQLYKINVKVNLKMSSETVWTVRDFTLGDLLTGDEFPDIE
ncbi:hypothetical protein DFJ63DRAFT_314749 [Scheffersomyces coipomensis]|uniref:uncharacterized protein n=1 Tax=Scheffersomyces coipomensis TaxID=1788519 RepID=UPI00315D30C7